MTQSDFIRNYWPLAYRAGLKFDINPTVILAQAATESGLGNSYGAKYRNNFFGIIATKKTSEYWSGKKSQSKSSGLWFRVYNSAQDSFYDFARLISSKYAEAAKVSHNPAKYARAIAYSSYISEKNGDNRPAYEKAIITFSNAIDGTEKKNPDGQV